MQLLKLSHIQGLPDDPMQISITDGCCKSPELDTHSQTSITHTSTCVLITYVASS